MRITGNRLALYACLFALAIVAVTIEYSRTSGRTSDPGSPETAVGTKTAVDASADASFDASVRAGVGTVDDAVGTVSSSTPLRPDDEVLTEEIPTDEVLSDEVPGAGAPRDDGPIGAGDNPEALTNPNPPAADVAQTSMVRFVYFVEADQDFDPSAVEQIEQQALALQQFWYDQFGGTFHLAPESVDVIYGSEPAAWYDTKPNGDDPRWYRLMNIRAEVRAQLELAPSDMSVRIVTFPNARIDGKVGAHRYGGAWMDGDDIGCISGRVATTPYTADFPANCLGTLAHELGHVFGLGHQGLDEDCMQYGFYDYVSGSDLCDFSPDNRAVVLNDPANIGWLTAQPGDRR